MMDYSTIDTEKLKRLPIYDSPPTYQLQKDPGNGCFLDSPGYPTYFTQSIYTRAGNEPHKGPTMVICFQGMCYVIQHNDDWNTAATWDQYHAKLERRMEALWVPLPIEHRRVQLWINYLTGYFKNCYHDPTKEGGDATRVGFFAPVQLEEISKAYNIGYPKALVGVDWKDVLGRANEDSVEHQKYRKVRSLLKDVASMSNRRIRRFYPSFVRKSWEYGYGSEGSGHWWETDAEQPTPENCKPRSMGPHPINGTRCQWCGWEASE